MTMGRFLSPRPAPSDAAPLMALLARGELAEVDAERERLGTVIADLRPHRSRLLEDKLRRLTIRSLKLRVAIRGGAR